MKIEIGEPGTRSAGCIRYEGQDWKHPDVYDAVELVRQLREDLESFCGASSARERTVAVSGRH